jgi:hypothetical protein
LVAGGFFHFQQLWSVPRMTQVGISCGLSSRDTCCVEPGELRLSIIVKGGMMPRYSEQTIQ